MHTNLIAFLFAVGTVVLAEMGDKTQLLAMAFATKYKVSKVLIGVLIATVLNHALAVAAGNFITRFQSVETLIQALASISFVFFGLWTIRGDKLDGEENRISKYGPVAAVAVAFFLAEMGDKTQLATIALSAKFSTSPVVILMGTTTGMLIADGIGIIIGVVMCKRIPERAIKLLSAGAFIIFGFIGSYQVLENKFKLELQWTLGVLTALLVITGIISWYLIKNNPISSDNPDVSEYCRVRNINNLALEDNTEK